MLSEKKRAQLSGATPSNTTQQLWVLRSTMNFKATDATLASGEGLSSDHTFCLRHQLREVHVPLSYQLSPLDVGTLDLGRDRGQDQ